MPEVLVAHDRIVGFEDVQAQVSTAPNSTNNVTLKKTLRNNFRCYLAFLGMAWDAALDTHLTWRLKQDGGTVWQFQDSKVQIAPPEQPWQEITPWLEVPQGCTLTFECDIDSTPAGNGNVTARMRIYYAPLDQPNLPGGK